MQSQESLVPLRDLPKKLPKRDGKRISHTTIWRWRTRGIAGCRLEVVYLGGLPYCSVAKVEQFFADVTAAKQAKMTPQAAPPMAAKTRSNGAHQAAKKILSKSK